MKTVRRIDATEGEAASDSSTRGTFQCSTVPAGLRNYARGRYGPCPYVHSGRKWPFSPITHT
jgi:hypothetical protein